ncbi:MAG: bifunctional hydroxymethylpyrimidine kinase/phosphomethylpyrimidine kinase [Rhodospirillales bacterium]|nr:bifunctional hydroxymethylpyrimidine kinase/phosphomethylpyrimidine kinase [Rhodospirillales bacterium]
MKPNHFELETLVGRALPTLAQVLTAADALRAQGPSLLVILSLTSDEISGGMSTLLVCDEGAWLASTRRSTLRARGAGDLLASQFLARWLRQDNPAACLSGAVAATLAVLEETGDAPELRLVAAQEAMVRADDRPLTLRRLR